MASEMPINFGNMCFGNSKRMGVFSLNTCPVNSNLTQSWSWGIGLSFYLSQSNQIFIKHNESYDFWIFTHSIIM
jgi:hypothetical protein